MQCWIQRALLYLQHFARNLLNPLGDGPAVLWFQKDCFQDQKIESSLHEITWLSHTMIIYNKLV